MRKIVQIIPSSDEQELRALCDDGSVWTLYYDGNKSPHFQWLRYPDIPQEAPHEH